MLIAPLRNALGTVPGASPFAQAQNRMKARVPERFYVIMLLGSKYTTEHAEVSGHSLFADRKLICADCLLKHK